MVHIFFFFTFHNLMNKWFLFFVEGSTILNDGPACPRSRRKASLPLACNILFPHLISTFLPQSFFVLRALSRTCMWYEQ